MQKPWVGSKLLRTSMTNSHMSLLLDSSGKTSSSLLVVGVARGFDTKTPEPPPPPTRMTYPPNTIKEPECEFPPPPESDTKSKLSEESVGQISEENKENIVKQWVESTTQSAEEIAKELEKFAYDIAETVVSNMEKNSEKKTQKTQPAGGLYFAAPASTTHRELHGPVYVQEDNRRVGMTFQQEERRREELRKQEEAKQEEKRKLDLELEAQRSQEEQQRRLVEMRRAQEEEKRLEMEKQQMLALQRQEEERKRQAEIEEKKRQEERRRAEEERLKQQELKMIEEEKKRQEILRFEKLKQEEELKRQEEMRLEQEMRRQYEMQQQIQRQKEQQLLLEQQQLELQRQKEQQLLLEQQQMEAQRQREQQFLLQQQQLEQQRFEMERQKEQQLLQEQQRINQDSIGVRDHIPKVSKTKSFEASQDRQNEMKTEDHLSLIKTGQVNEKRNFWMRSTSADRVNQASLSPAPRRRRIDWNAKQKENDDPESRPGSSLGQATTGSVRNLSSGFIAKSKSSAAVMQDEVERGRPKQRTVIANGWTKEQYDQKVKQEFFRSQEVKTNKVNDTVQTWGKRDSSQTGR